ncbi:kinase-like domain-containing protein [Glomus cerebriforme]|uniref:Kinase-like domain-containing protein n=1 Tax=Glomus cerebriforme TaxID=658196 RepID=A0A397TPC5_9GLOM|nr:kinase-like domain-containing protein [Glomus cerebriforme]
MSTAAINRATASIDYNIYDDVHKQHKFLQKTILADKSLTKDEKTKIMRLLDENYDRKKILFNDGERRISKFSDWTSGNNDIDNLIRKCQTETFIPYMVVEWIPYDHLQNIAYLTKGGCSEIYTAYWIDGHYEEWDPKEQQLKRVGGHYVILKTLKNVEDANQSWLDEAKSHLTISNKWGDILRCFGLTQDPLNGDYMLVMLKMDIDLRNYLQQNHNQLKWEERVMIMCYIIEAIFQIHFEKAIHRDLHSGNVLYSQFNGRWRISDLGFCGPADKSPKISGTPLEYESLMKQCWDADPLKRPDINTVRRKMREIKMSYINTTNKKNSIIKRIFSKFNLFKSETNDNLKTHESINLKTDHSNSRLSTSKIYQFEGLPEPRNATEEEQEAFHSKPYDFDIPDNIDDFNNSSGHNYVSTSKTNIILNDVKDDYKKETMQYQLKKQNIVINDDDEICNNQNFHSEEQDELEIPDDGF